MTPQPIDILQNRVKTLNDTLGSQVAMSPERDQVTIDHLREMQKEANVQALNALQKGGIDTGIARLRTAIDLKLASMNPDLQRNLFLELQETSEALRKGGVIDPISKTGNAYVDTPLNTVQTGVGHVGNFLKDWSSVLAPIVSILGIRWLWKQFTGRAQEARTAAHETYTHGGGWWKWILAGGAAFAGYHIFTASSTPNTAQAAPPASIDTVGKVQNAIQSMPSGELFATTAKHNATVDGVTMEVGDNHMKINSKNLALSCVLGNINITSIKKTSNGNLAVTGNVVGGFLPINGTLPAEKLAAGLAVLKDGKPFTFPHSVGAMTTQITVTPQ